MKKTYVLLMVVLLISASIMAQPHMMGERDCDAPRPPRHEGMCAQSCDGHGMGMKGKHGQAPMMRIALRFADEIGLTDEQREQIEKARFKHKMSMIDLKADVARAKLQVKALTRDDDANEVEVMRAIDQVAKAKAEMAKMKYKNRKKMKSILTDQQRAKLTELRKERQSKRMEMHHRGFERERGDKKSFRGYRRNRS